jgi:very-short-patch-repair endonuclease
MSRSVHQTCLERRMAQILSSLEVDYSEQVATRSGFVIDFAIYVDRASNKKIAIETDGKHWHSSPEQRQRDGFRDHILRRNGWIILRFGEEFTREGVRECLNHTLTRLGVNPV